MVLSNLKPCRLSCPGCFSGSSWGVWAGGVNATWWCPCVSLPANSCKRLHLWQRFRWLTEDEWMVLMEFCLLGLKRSSLLQQHTQEACRISTKSWWILKVQSHHLSQIITLCHFTASVVPWAKTRQSEQLSVNTTYEKSLQADGRTKGKGRSEAPYFSRPRHRARGTGYLCTWLVLPAGEQLDSPISSQLQSGPTVNREGGLAGSRDPRLSRLHPHDR